MKGLTFGWFFFAKTMVLLASSPFFKNAYFNYLNTAKKSNDKNQPHLWLHTHDRDAARVEKKTFCLWKRKYPCILMRTKQERSKRPIKEPLWNLHTEKYLKTHRKNTINFDQFIHFGVYDNVCCVFFFNNIKAFAVVVRLRRMRVKISLGLLSRLLPHFFPPKHLTL